ncbi:hypothetical protein K443DRAFT_47908, partial [Laccaria amethystina LaAM-08-1]
LGFDISTFNSILESGFAEAWMSTSILRTDTSARGGACPGARSLDPAGVLGLVLHYLNSTMFRECSNLIRSRHPRLKGAFASIDGLNLAVQTSADDDIENATFNGWLQEHFISSVLVFSPLGTIL